MMIFLPIENVGRKITKTINDQRWQKNQGHRIWKQKNRVEKEGIRRQTAQLAMM